MKLTQKKKRKNQVGKNYMNHRKMNTYITFKRQKMLTIIYLKGHLFEINKILSLIVYKK